MAMIDTLAIYERLKDKMEPAVAESIAEVLGSALAQIQQSVTEGWQQQVDQSIAAMRAEVDARLTRIEKALEQLVLVQQQHSREIADLREATQRNTEAIAELREAVAELRQTVERLVQITEQHSRDITDLREATQRNTEAIAELRQTVERLVQVTEQHSQMFKEMTQRVQQNTENIEKLRQRVEELSERTQREIRDLVKSIADLRRQFGGLAMTVGYSLEDQAYKALPSLLQRDYGIQVEGRLKRQFVQDSEGRYLEVNIFGQARRDGETVTIVGEGKVQLSKNDVKEFLRRKVKRLQEIYPNIFPVLVTRMISEWDAEDYARARGVALYYSYDF
ncbi:MAG: hypothetical protein NZ741_04290 [Armatimonadetes bacterium]|nr:hypothetical protein [Armatimonadota bacterium]